MKSRCTSPLFLGTVSAIIALTIPVGIIPAGGGSETPAEGTDSLLTVATFNVHYIRGADARVVTGGRGGDKNDPNPLLYWSGRDLAVVEVLRKIDADIVAFQEMETFRGGHSRADNLQMETVGNAFPGFSFTATGDPEEYPNTQPILYRRERFVAGEQGYFFFSPTPDVLYSGPWLGRYPSYGTWARLQDRHSAYSFLVVNVHIDRERYRNKILSAELTAKVIQSVRRAGETVVLLGDFNSVSWSRVLGIVSRETGLLAAPTKGSTYHFYRGIHVIPAIDHVLYPPTLVGSTTVERARPFDIWPSDHYPVVVELRGGEYAVSGR